MRLRRTTLALAMVMLLLVAPLSAVAATPAPAAPAAGAAISFPIDVNSPSQGTFTGTLSIRRFAVQGGQIVALGTVAGTLTDKKGNRTGIVRNVVQTVTIRGASAAESKQPQGSSQQVTMRKASLQEGCQVLHLDLGPVNLNLGGLAVNISAVTFDIAGEPGPVGDLVCAVLDLVGNVTAVVELLNTLLGLVTGLLGGLGGAVGGLG